MLISSLFCCIFIVAEPEKIPFQKPKTPQAFSSNLDAIGNNKPVDTVVPNKERAENSLSFAGDLMLNVHEEKETATSVDVEKGIESPGRKKESIVGEKGVNYEMKNDEEKRNDKNSGEATTDKNTVIDFSQSVDKEKNTDSCSNTNTTESHGVTRSNERAGESEPSTKEETSITNLLNGQCGHTFVKEARTMISKQRVVTFEDMNKHRSYSGPLITPEQLIDEKEDLSKIIFTRDFMSLQQHGQHKEQAYRETTVDELTTILKDAQELYNQQDVQSLDIVFFEKVVRHAARLSRSLVRE